MKSISVCVAIAAFTFATFTVAENSTSGEDALGDTKSSRTDNGETLADAVLRINSEVTERFGVLSPSPLTVPVVKSAIEATVKELSESDAPHRVAYVNALTRVLANERIPSSIRFIVVPITGTYSKEQKEQFRDGRHIDISINYILEVPRPGAGANRRAIGLRQIVELFRITKPQEQKKPLDSPTAANQRP